MLNVDFYVTAKLNNYIYVIDIRDDSTDDFEDRNYLDLEALISVESTIGSRGFRDAIALPGTNRLYAAGQRPDALVVFDLTPVSKTTPKKKCTQNSLAPFRFSRPRGRTLMQARRRVYQSVLAVHNWPSQTPTSFWSRNFWTTAPSVFDMSGGGLGTETRYLPAIGESPYAIAISLMANTPSLQITWGKRWRTEHVQHVGGHRH